MADLPEVSEFTEGVRAFESTDPARYDVLNNALQPLVNRTKWLKDNMGQGGGGGSAPVEWLSRSEEEDPNVDIASLDPGTVYIQDVRNNFLDVGVYESTSIDIPIGSEFHFVCAGDPVEAGLFRVGAIQIITAAGLAVLDGDNPIFNKNGSIVTLKKISETDWLLFGDVAEGDSEGFVAPSADIVVTQDFPSTDSPA